MAHKIPKIQYANATLAGNTANTNPTISSITSTKGLSAGMIAKGTGIPVGSKIISLTSTSVTLDHNATATNTGTSIDYYFEIVFDYPPIEPKGEALDSHEHISVSISGLRQVSLDFIEGIRKMKFAFLSQSLKDSFQTFFSTHALYGKVFRYFDDKNSVSYIEYELSTLKFDPVIITPKGTSAYLWDVPMDLRRVI